VLNADETLAPLGLSRVNTATLGGRMYFADLSTETQVDGGAHVRAIGWLSRDRPFATGDVPSEFSARLRSLCAASSVAARALRWPAAGGLHECEFCGDYSSAGNLGVPAGELLFVAPQMVAHYVDHHHYEPPASFLSAVMSCPEPGTEAFRLAIAPFCEGST
jgi:hypothetical protein